MVNNQKTNVMRLLDAAEIVYTPHYYGNTEAIAGLDVAAALNEAPEKVFKTLVTEDNNKNHFVFVIPVTGELNLKKAAKAAGVKSIVMLKSKELLPLTGYIHGGCSPIGMKKVFPTFFDETAQLFDTVFFSAGKIGYQVELAPSDIEKVIKYQYADLTD